MANEIIQGSMITPEDKKTKENNIPDSLKDKDIKETKVSKLSNIIEEKLMQLKDLATLQLRMPVDSRMRDRLKSIQKMSKALHLKIEGHWDTTPPEVHITRLEARKVSNDEAQIKFSVYEVDKDGNKKLYENKVPTELADGRVIEKVLSAEYRVAYEVTEIIERNKPIRREVVEIDTNR